MMVKPLRIQAGIEKGKEGKGGLTHVEVEPILWLRTKQIMAGIKLFGHCLLCA